jgi:hypothetical protein
VQMSLVDGVMRITTAQAMETARDAALKDGLLVCASPMYVSACTFPRTQLIFGVRGPMLDGSVQPENFLNVFEC